MSNQLDTIFFAENCEDCGKQECICPVDGMLNAMQEAIPPDSKYCPLDRDWTNDCGPCEMCDAW